MAVTVSAAASMTLSASLLEFATYTRLPSALATTPRGRLPTAIVLSTVPLSAAITVTSSERSFVTKMRSSACASDAVTTTRTSDASQRRTDTRESQRSTPQTRPAPVTRKMTIDVTNIRWNPC